MKIGDALGIIGPVSLDLFPWGQTVVGIINSHLADTPENERPTVESTGTEVWDILNKLSEEQRDAILDIELGALGKTTIDVVNESVPGRVDYAKKTRSIFAVVFGGVILLISIVLTLALYQTSTTSGTMGDTSGLEGVLKVAIEIFKIVYGDSSGSQ